MTLTLAEGIQMTSSAKIMTGQCAVWALPHTSACAEAARARVREALSTLLPSDRLDDCVLMASELGTNAFLHGLDGLSLEDRYAPDAGRSELAIYRRGPENAAEMVVTVFDPRPDLLPRTAEPISSPLAELPDKELDERLPTDIMDKLLEELPDLVLESPADEALDEALPESPEAAQRLLPQRWSGKRGLDTVRELSEGRYGFYRTTSRLGARPVSGKVAWFAIPLAPDSLAASPPRTAEDPGEAMEMLRSQLEARGIKYMIHNHLDNRSVLSLPHTTVWSYAAAFTWRVDDKAPVRLAHADLVETVEQLLRINEDREYSPLRTSL